MCIKDKVVSFMASLQQWTNPLLFLHLLSLESSGVPVILEARSENRNAFTLVTEPKIANKGSVRSAGRLQMKAR